MRLITYQLLQAFKSLTGKPILVASFTSTLGLSVGALLAVLPLFYTLVIKPLPYPNADRMYLVDMDVAVAKEDWIVEENRVQRLPRKSIGALLDLYKMDKQVFVKKGLADYGSDILSSSNAATSVELAYVTSDWFDLWGMNFVKGRPFQSKLGDSAKVPTATLR